MTGAQPEGFVQGGVHAPVLRTHPVAHSAAVARSWQLRGGRVFTVELVGIGVGPGDPDLLTVAQGGALVAYKSCRRLAQL